MSSADPVLTGGRALPANPGAAATLQRILLNAAALLGAYVLPRGLTFFAALAAARQLGPAEFGAYSTATSLAMILSIFATLGMLPLLVRDLARTPERAAELLRAAHLIKAAASLGMIMALWATARFVLGYSPTIVAATLLLGLGHVCISFAENIGAWFQAHERMRVWLEANIVFGLCAGALGLLAVYSTGSLLWFCAAFATGQLAELGWLIWRMPRASVKANRALWPEVRLLIHQTTPFAIAFLALTVFYKFDVLLLQRLQPGEVVGVYAAGYKLVDIVHALAVIAAAALYPRLARLLNQPDRAAAASRTLELFLLAGTSGAALLWLLRGSLTHLLFGSEYAGTAAVLGLLAPALVSLVINILAGYLLSVADRIGWLAVAYILACGLKLVLGLWWVPLHGAEGMAAAKLVSETTLSVLLLAALAALHAGRVSARAAGLALGSAILALPAVALARWSTELTAVVAYTTAVFLLYRAGGAVLPSELQALHGALRLRPGRGVRS